jgi:hypothetical protein
MHLYKVLHCLAPGLSNGIPKVRAAGYDFRHINEI